MKFFMIWTCSLHTPKHWEQPPSHPPWNPKYGSIFPDIFPRMGQQGSERRARAAYSQWQGWFEGVRASFQRGFEFRVCTQGKGTEAEFTHLEESDQGQKLTPRTNQTWQSKQSSSGGNHHLFIDGILFIVQCVNRPVPGVPLGEWKRTIEL